ncbi:electron transport complex protein RnfB [Dokdonella fugitiva]|uniref:Electron transport complex protein RnfB n=1 Tax=Dokdonella fugitiva TaxID=328517 RepID=A0A839EXL2_9GAMM|nr:RnfABCDGE type electron transport complex subunit B [Dokdonella fugitiva]MBA8885908.1 electron transport complex protein RnfB [Dokdonella fugitiva]
MNAEDSALLAARIDALLPQTQCTRCGFPTCRAYADAIATGEADIDRCPPGGADGVVALANLLGIAAKPLDPAYGVEAPPIVAVIDEDVCIGCTKCIQACPVDAIVGAAKRMHTVIADECTGCELCLPPCPVDCIALVPVAAMPLSRAGVLERAAAARERFEARTARTCTRNTVGAAEAAMLFAMAASSSREESIAASAAPTNAAPAAAIAGDAAIATEAAPTTAGARPIDRAAVLAAIARGKARRAKDTDGS